MGDDSDKIIPDLGGGRTSQQHMFASLFTRFEQDDYPILDIQCPHHYAVALVFSMKSKTPVQDNTQFSYHIDNLSSLCPSIGSHNICTL